MRRFCMLAVCLAMALTLMGCGRTTGDATPSGTDVPVSAPTLAGMDATAAASALAAAGLRTGTVTESYSPTAPAGSLIAQDPIPGADTPKGSSIDLVVSKGPAPADVPNVIGQAEADATAALEAAGFKVVKVSAAGTATVGTVVKQSPSGGGAELGSTVRITVSSGPLVRQLTGTWRAKGGATYEFRAGNRVVLTDGGVVRYRSSGDLLLVYVPGRYETYVIHWDSADAFTLALLDKNRVPGKAVTYKRVP